MFSVGAKKPPTTWLRLILYLVSTNEMCEGTTYSGQETKQTHFLNILQNYWFSKLS